MTDKVMVTKKRSSANKEFQDVDNDAESNQVLVLEEELPPVPIIEEYISEFYAITSDVFHR